eukprot:9413898-Karenia_brevis.AAC.1
MLCYANANASADANATAKASAHANANVNANRKFNILSTHLHSVKFLEHQDLCPAYIHTL